MLFGALTVSGTQIWTVVKKVRGILSIVQDVGSLNECSKLDRLGYHGVSYFQVLEYNEDLILDVVGSYRVDHPLL